MNISLKGGKQTMVESCEATCELINLEQPRNVLVVFFPNSVRLTGLEGSELSYSISCKIKMEYLSQQKC